MSSLWRSLRRVFTPESDELDRALDYLIQEALWEDALAQPPQGTWERLRMMLDRRRVQREGMWVLEEPLRDPPESLPMLLSLDQFMRAQRLHIEGRHNTGWHIRANAFLFPTFSALINY